MSDQYKQIAEMIFVRRRRKGMSQSELAEAVNVSRNYISMIERGQTQNVSLEVIFNICAALDMWMGIILKIVWLMMSRFSNRRRAAHARPLGAYLQIKTRDI